jgi:hypothetical protein
MVPGIPGRHEGILGVLGLGKSCWLCLHDGSWVIRSLHRIFFLRGGASCEIVRLMLNAR